MVSTLGTGGMGVVWKAIDTRLNRPVAIKAIRDAVGAETQAVLRLRAEALAAAALDHPYICKIYELLETEEGTLVVMEFVEGETLEAILERGVPPTIDTLRYGSEIAEGLANAHAKGIIHRDVKPANVMITPHGHVKLLDFGIARAAAVGDLPTEAALTRPGLIPGTPQYMAPEQALGRRIDARVDVYALGVVLFQCLAGQLPYEGITRDAYVQQMLSGRMRPLDTLAPNAPEPVRDIVRACLEGDPEDRPASMQVAETLRRYADALSTASTGIPVAAPRGLPRWALQVAALVLVAAALAVAWRYWRAPGDDATPRALLPAVTWPSAESDPRISPDGKWLSFISDRDNQTRIFVKSLDGGDAVPVALTGVAESHTWSPDGRELACVMRQGGDRFLVVVPAFFGGTPRVSVRLDTSLVEPTISRWTGNVIYLRRVRQPGQSIVSVTIPDGQFREFQVTWPDGFTIRHLDVAPDERSVIIEAVADGRTDLWTAGLDGTGLRRLTDDDFVERAPSWIGTTGAVAFHSNRGGQLDLWQRSTASGRMTQITSSETVERAGGAASDGSVLAFEQALNTVHLWRLDIAGGTTKQLTGDALSDFWPSVTADDTRLAFQRAKPAPVEGYQFFDSRILVTAMSGAMQTDPQPIADGFAARLSADGAWVAYLQRLPDVSHLRLVARNLATGEARTVSERCVLPTLLLLPVDWGDQTVTWSASGADLFFIAQGDRGPEVLRAPLATASDAVVLARGPAKSTIRDLRLSPDGRHLAFLVAAGGAVEVHAVNVEDGSSRVVLREQRSLSNRYLPGWSDNGTLLLQDARHTGGRRFENHFDEVSLAGARRTIRTVVDNAASTATVDHARRRMFVTRAVEGIHNIYALSLADGTLHRITTNESPGVYFSAIAPQRSDAIIYARDERKRDIWLVKRGQR